MEGLGYSEGEPAPSDSQVVWGAGSSKQLVYCFGSSKIYQFLCTMHYSPAILNINDSALGIAAFSWLRMGSNRSMEGQSRADGDEPPLIVTPHFNPLTASHNDAVRVTRPEMRRIQPLTRRAVIASSLLRCDDALQLRLYEHKT